MNKRKSGSESMLVGVCLLAVLAMGGAAWAQDETATEAAAETVAAPSNATFEMTFGTDLDRASRTLIGAAASFAAVGFTAEEGQVFCLTRVQNLAAPATLTHVWYHEGKTMARVELTVGSADWRTWSSKRILPTWTGAWEVKVLDANGMVLASAGFTVN